MNKKLILILLAGLVLVAGFAFVYAKHISKEGIPAKPHPRATIQPPETSPVQRIRTGTLSEKPKSVEDLKDAMETAGKSYTLPATEEHRTPIVLQSTTTIQRDTVHTRIGPLTNFPVDFILEIIPAGGTVKVRFDGNLVAEWNDESVVVGESFDLNVYFVPNVSSVGEASVEFSYLMRPSYRIDLVLLESFWDYGLPPDTLEGRFPLSDSVPESIIWRYISIDDTTQDNLFLLGDTIVSGEEWEDTVQLSFTHSPYPCVELTVSATVKTSLYFTLATDTLCIRYSPYDGDTLCWEYESGFDCQTALSPGWTSFTVVIPCEETADFVIPLCPIRAAVHAQVKIGTEVRVDTLKVRYTCASPVDSLSDTSSVKDSTWLTQEIDFGTDRDDAIFTVPVPLDSVVVNVIDPPNPLGAYDTLYQDSTYTIAWGPLDPALDACCSSYSVGITYRDIVYLDTNLVCSGEVAEISGDRLSWTVPIIEGVADGIEFRLYSVYLDPDSARSGDVAEISGDSFSWTVPEIECFVDGTEFRLFIEFYCTTGRTLYHAWSETFIYGE